MSLRHRQAGSAFLVALTCAIVMAPSPGVSKAVPGIAVTVPEAWSAIGTPTNVASGKVLAFTMPAAPDSERSSGGTLVIRTSPLDPETSSEDCSVHDSPGLHEVDVETRELGGTHVATWRADGEWWQSMTLAEPKYGSCVRVLAVYVVTDQRNTRRQGARARQMLEVIRSTRFNGRPMFVE